MIRPNLSERLRSARAFTLVEVLVVIAIIAILTSLLMTSLNSAKSRAEAIACMNNNKQLTTAWLIYAHDNQDRLIYNIGGDSRRGVVDQVFLPNWVNGILDWELTPDNTNSSLVLDSGLASYVSRNISLFQCPSDRALSDVQSQAGWERRTRSYSMNAMVGDAGPASLDGYNVNNPYYVQFFKLSSIPEPAEIFVTVEEHPDSINDGYFLNKAYSREWIDLPASWHNAGATLAFVDGHALIRRWENQETVRPPEPDAAALPLAIAADRKQDFNWLVEKSSVHR